MSRWSCRLLCILGCLVLAVTGSGRAGIAQFAEQVLQHQREAEASAQSANQADFSVQAGVQLPKCPNLGVLSNNGVPNEWQYMSVEEQAAHPINAIALQLAYVAWQNEPKATLGHCLANLGVDLDSVTTVHKIVLPYLGTMSAVVMKAGRKGVFVSFRGTDFDDPGDVLVDADCQYTDNKGALFGSKSDIRLHTGFYRAWESVAPDVVPTVWKLLQQTDAKKVYVVGHSLGGAMAAIAALRLNYLLKNTDTGAEVGGVWLFGCPRIGNQAWQDEYHRRLLTKTLRMANFGDFASRLPMQTQFCPSAAKLLSNYEFRHVGRSVVLCPESATGLTNWRLSAGGSETLDCAHWDPPDLTLTTHWLGPYLDAWRRAHATAYPMGEHGKHVTANVTMSHATNGTLTRVTLQSVNLASDPHITSIMCEECSLSFPNDRNKQLNVPARAGGPIGCCTSASCSMQSAWDAVATIGAQITRTFNPLSVCSGYICT